jgi:hypothetical protein
VATPVMARLRALVELGLACAAVVGVARSWLHSRHTGIIAPIADGQPTTTALVYDPQLLLLTMWLAIFAGVLAVAGVARLRRTRR